MPTPAGYSRRQLRLHWIIALLIGFQYVAHEGIEDAWEKIEKGGTMEFSGAAGAHVAVGILILLLAIWRIIIRLHRGAPALPAEESGLQKTAAHATHGLLYLLMLLIPISGLSAWFGGIKPAAEGHGFMTGVLLLLLALHVLAALYHHFILKTDVLRRIFKPDTSA